MRLEGKVAAITGGASGIGLAIATRFAAEGAKIVISDQHAQRLDVVVESIKDSGGLATSSVGNIGERKIAEGLIDLAIDTYGRLDILCNNAGVMDQMQGVGELEDDIWRRVLNINLDGPMFTSRRAVKYMMKQEGGSIINVVSDAALHGGRAGAAYTTSKHGLLGLTRSTAWMYAKQGVRCNAICPGGTKTNIVESMAMDKLDSFGFKRASEIHQLSPALLEPSDFEGVALFLASDESRRINGAIITVDDGLGAL